MNLQETAQKLIEKLQEDLKNVQDQVKVISGAIQGVNLLFKELITEQNNANEDIKDGAKEAIARPKKRNEK